MAHVRALNCLRKAQGDLAKITRCHPPDYISGLLSHDFVRPFDERDENFGITELCSVFG
jgi:hypothetical protein